MNVEWHPEHSLRSPLPLLPFWFIGTLFKQFMSPAQVLYSLKLCVGFTGIYMARFMSTMIGKTLGKPSGNTFLFLFVFTYGVIESIGNLSMDNFLTIANMLAVGLMFKGSMKMLMLVSIITTSLRINYGLMSVFLLGWMYYQKPKGISVVSWMWYIIKYHLIFGVVWLLIMTLVSLILEQWIYFATGEINKINHLFPIPNTC